MPYNQKTGVEYKGMNIGALAGRGYKSEAWATFLQWRELGYKVKKGEKATHCRTFGKIEGVSKDGKPTSENYFKAFCVFNSEQVEAIECNGVHKDCNEIINCKDCAKTLDAMDTPSGAIVGEAVKPSKACNHCGGKMVEGMCDAPLSVAD